MKILLAGTVDLSTQRGDTLHFLHLANALRLRGHNIDMIGLNKPSSSLINGISVHSVKRSMVKTGSTFSNDMRLLWKVFQTSRYHYDVFYQRGIPLANRLVHARNIPSILEVNGSRMEELRLRGFSHSRLAFHKLRETQMINAADHYVCVTEGIRDQLIHDFQVAENQCTVISNAADTDLFRPLPQKDCQQSLGLPQDKFHVGFVGTFQEWVDFDSLFFSLSILRDQGIPVYCTLVGDGSLEPYLRQQVQKLVLSDIVLFAGRQDQTDIPKWLSAFDAGIAPFKKARNETIGLSPLKLFEYMACERPIIATTLPGIIEPVEAAQSGRLYSIEDPGSMAQQFLWLYQNPDLRILMGKRGREYILKHHSWAVVAEKVEQIMRKVCRPDRASKSIKNQL